jgi:hypothetical protein
MGNKHYTLEDLAVLLEEYVENYPHHESNEWYAQTRHMKQAGVQSFLDWLTYDKTYQVQEQDDF